MLSLLSLYTELLEKSNVYLSPLICAIQTKIPKKLSLSLIQSQIILLKLTPKVIQHYFTLVLVRLSINTLSTLT